MLSFDGFEIGKEGSSSDVDRTRREEGAARG